MTPAYLTSAFAYDTAVNRRLLDALRALPNVGERTQAVFAHILAARAVWIERLQHDGRSSTPVWPTLDWDACEAMIEGNDQTYTAYLAEVSLADLEAPFTYYNSTGRGFTNRPLDVLMHVLIHGGYHRGQVAQAVRLSGYQPMNTDYIFYLRE
ncbi:MAG: DinB family protein [Bacteroidota bacterium]